MDQKEKLGLQSAAKYFYLNQGGSFEIESKYDHEDFMSLLQAMDVLGFSTEDKTIIFKILASILHLGNICFKKKLGKDTEIPSIIRHQSHSKQKDFAAKQTADSDSSVELASTAEIKWVAYLLGLSESGLSKALTFKMTATCTERVYSPYNIDQALDTRDAFAKALYTSLFTWLVGRINSAVGEHQSTSSISVLDIFGFENFSKNSFEQLCINFANETLQLFFNKHVFKQEQEEYKAERISWSVIGFKDNQSVIDMISKKPLGILHLLDDESNFPKGTDFSFLEKCHYHHGSKMCYSKPKMSHAEFIITHYAGDVTYDVNNFLEKNRDSFRSDVASLLLSSKHKIVAQIFGGQCHNSFDQPSLYDTHIRVNRLQNIRPRIATVGAKFNDSLSQLMETMSSCHPWFIRCIKPNHDKIPLKFDMRMVLQQLRSTGTLETIRIRKLGYPIGLKFTAFMHKYRCLVQLKSHRIPREECENLLSHTSKNYQDHYQVGASMIFMREILETHLEKMKARSLNKSALILQRNLRRYLAVRKFQQLRLSAVKLQSLYRGSRQRRKFLRERQAAIKIQAQWRMQVDLRQFQLSLAVAKKIAQEKENNFRMIKSELPRYIIQILNSVNENANDDAIGVCSTNTAPIITSEINDSLPKDIESFNYMKFVEHYFEGRPLQTGEKLLNQPILQKKSAENFNDSRIVSKLVLLYSGGTFLSSQEKYVLANYIASFGMRSVEMRDEIYAQLCWQTHPKNLHKAGPHEEYNLWQLLCICLSSFAPSPMHMKYILNYCIERNEISFSDICKKKLLRHGLENTDKPTRLSALTLLESRALESLTAMTLIIACPDEKIYAVEVESWSTAASAALTVLKSRGVDPEELFGWTVSLQKEQNLLEINGDGYIFDLISCKEYPNSIMFKDCSLNCISLQDGSNTQNETSEPYIWKGGLQLDRNNTESEAPIGNIPLPGPEHMNDVSAFLDKVFDEALDYQFLNSEDNVTAIARSIKGVTEAETKNEHRSNNCVSPNQNFTQSSYIDPVNHMYRQQLQNVYYNQLMQIMQLHSLQSSTLQNVQHNVFGKAVSKVLGTDETDESPILPQFDENDTPLESKIVEGYKNHI